MFVYELSSYCSDGLRVTLWLTVGQMICRGLLCQNGEAALISKFFLQLP